MWEKLFDEAKPFFLFLILESEFWLNICLTMALFVPGSIYAVIVVTTKENKGTK